MKVVRQEFITTKVMMFTARQPKSTQFGKLNWAKHLRRRRSLCACPGELLPAPIWRQIEPNVPQLVAIATNLEPNWYQAFPTSGA